MRELPPPPVTIRNPSRQAQGTQMPADVDQPLSRANRQGQLVAVVLLVLVATAVLGLAHRRAAAMDAELDRAALTELTVVLSAAVQDELQPVGTDVPVVLRNEGPRPLTVVSIRLDQPGYAAQPVRIPLAPAQDATVVIRTGPGCREPAAEVGPQRLLVVAQDLRGGRRQLALATAPEMLDEQLLTAGRRACGLLPVQESLQPGAVQVRRARDTVELEAPLQNVGLGPVTLVRIAPDPGLGVMVEPALPVALHPGVGGLEPTQLLRIRLRVVSCRALARRALLGQDGRSLVLKLRGGDGSGGETTLLPGRAFDRVLDRLEQETCKLSPHGL